MTARRTRHGGDPVRHGSLFSGYGGIDRAVADVFGAETAWVSDVDPGANRILAHRYPDAPNLGDITKVDWSAVEPVHIISGGSPCPDLSLAGRRAGMTEGTRSNLWVSMREAIAVLKPTYVVWENVRGAMSAKADSGLEHCPGCMGDPGDEKRHLRALGRVLGDLADLGYDAQWHGLRAADVGACHGRWRVFVLAYTNEQRHERRWGARDGWTQPADSRGEAIALLPTPRATGGPNQRGSSGDLMLPSAVVQLLPTPVAQPSGNSPEVHLRKKPGRETVTDLAIVVENGLLATGGRLLPTPAANLGSNGGPQHPDKRRAGGHSVSIEDAVHGLALLPSAALQLDRSDELLLNGIAHRDRWGEYAEAIARHEQVFGRPAPDPTEPGPKGNPRLSAAFVEWMMMLPAGWVTDVPGITRNQAIKALGNGVVPPQAAAALRLMLDRMTLT